jgi:tyrosinase
MAMMPFGLWLQKDTLRRRKRNFVRYDARSVHGQAMLKIYAEAVCKMMETIKEGDPTNWIFQWYTHWVKGSTNKNAEINRVYGAGASPHKTLAQEMWNTCQAHGAGENEDFFLPWHRMFVYYFETMIRHVSGHAAFTLPYWNYSSSTPAIHGVMPDEFRKKGDPTFKCLFVDKRNVHTTTNSFANVNAGEPIDKYDPGALELAALKQTTYSPAGAAPGFNMDLDGSVHGAVHVLVGNSLNMGDIPWAAGDPVFWMHHCNIDRLWASWNACGGKNPTSPTWLNQTFTFADADGNKVVLAIKDVNTTAQLHYSYDHLELCPIRIAPRPEAEIAAIQATTLATLSAGATLTKSPVRVNLEVKSQAAGQPLIEHVRKLPPGRKLYLVIRNLHSDVHPETIYHVYLDLPPGTAPKDGSAYQIGTLNFFNAVPHPGHSGTAESNTETRFRSFDVTEIASKVLQDKPTVTIAPLGEPASQAKPMVGEISLVEQ